MPFDPKTAVEFNPATAEEEQDQPVSKRSMWETAFPSTVQSMQEGKSFPRSVGAALGDVLSAPDRAMGADAENLGFRVISASAQDSPEEVLRLGKEVNETFDKADFNIAGWPTIICWRTNDVLEPDEDDGWRLLQDFEVQLQEV